MYLPAWFWGGSARFTVRDPLGEYPSGDSFAGPSDAIEPERLCMLWRSPLEASEKERFLGFGA